ncbi:MAG: GTP pyrophosphokinase [Deltaproteobacteria bacterium]|nr:GTP pyrophosphokinase [Deltaproteobacteria bacterium]
MAPTLEDALAWALELYRPHEPDKGGNPYILHPLAVMMAMDTDEERRVALLHDAIEDCGVEPEHLRARGYPEREIEAVVALSRNEEQGETYEAFIERLRPNPLARKVKLADLAHNMDVRRLASVDEKARERLERYRRAWARLKEEG